jgi:hypothetical protein
MKLKDLTALACSMTVPFSAHSAPATVNVPSIERQGFQHLRAADLKADLYFLASDALQGRMSLQPGDEAATQWVAAEFAKAGARTAGGQFRVFASGPFDRISW